MPAPGYPGAGGAAPRLALLVLQPTPFCNIDCSYCYLADRGSPARMSLDTLDRVCQRVFESPLLGRWLDVAWHAGEPLVVPVSWYDEAVRRMAERRPAGLDLRHSFQTNGLLVDEAWTRFFARTGATVGLSVDGPADLHDANRRTRAGKGTHEGAMRAVRRLQGGGVDFHVITVLTEPALAEPERLFDFYVENGIRRVGFNVEEVEGAHARSSLGGDGAEARFRRFIRRFFDLVWEAPGLLEVREFEGAVGSLLSAGPVSNEQNSPLAILSVGHDGAVSSFSPELLGARHPRFDRFAFGDVATHALSDIERAPLFRDVGSEIRRGVEACERECRYFRWCGGGAPANKLFETGRFDSTETMHCRLVHQAVFDEVLAALEARTAQHGASGLKRCVQHHPGQGTTREFEP